MITGREPEYETDAITLLHFHPVLQDLEDVVPDDLKTFHVADGHELLAKERKRVKEERGMRPDSQKRERTSLFSFPLMI